MRKIVSCLLLLACLHVNGQNAYGSRWHATAGFSYASVNLNKNMAGAFSVPVRFDFVRFGKSAFSLGTNLKIGTEDRYGWSFPIVTIVLFAVGAAGGDASTLGDIDISKKVQPFAETPLLLHYNFGMSVRSWPEDHFGFYVGGGFDWTTTGFTDTAGIQHPVDFLGLMLGGGVRFGEGVDLGFNYVIPLPFFRAVGPITNPVEYEVTATFGLVKKNSRLISARRPLHR